MDKPSKQMKAEFKEHGLSSITEINKEWYSKYVTSPSKEVLKRAFHFGQIYTYQYDPKTKDKLAYYDTNPCTLIFDYKETKDGNHLFIGINLHFLPKDVKLTLLENYWKYFYRFGGKRLMNLMPFTYYKFFNLIFGLIAKIDFKFAIRSYLIDRVDNIAQINDDDWGKIIITRPQFMVKESIEHIYVDYYK